MLISQQLKLLIIIHRMWVAGDLAFGQRKLRPHQCTRDPGFDLISI